MILKKLIITLLVVFVLVVFLEILLRITDLGMPWDMDSLGRRKSFSDRSFESFEIIIAAGDSLTFGYRVLELYSYPKQLEIKLNKEEIRWAVINSGISGNTSVQLYERIDRDVLALNPRVVIIWIGTNDGMLKLNKDSNVLGECPSDTPPLLAKSVLLTTIDSLHTVMRKRGSRNRPQGNFKKLVPRVDIVTFQNNLKKIVHKVKDDGINKIILIGIPSVPDSFSGYAELVQLQRLIHKKFNDIIHKVAIELNIPFIDTQSMLNERCFLPDGLHFTREGYEIISKKVHDILYN
jgi:lysophospholipase L1-like esterase